MPPDTPDFDSMSPEEVMAWLESLAKRQGAHEGFTTAANVDIPEIDPSTVTIDEPGYVPYGETPPARPPQSVPARVEQPAASAPPVTPPAPARLPFADDEAEQETQVAPVAPAAQGLAWLESLAADQGGDFPQFDLSALTVEPTPPAAPPPANPLSWLESLAEGRPPAAPPAPATPPPAPDLTSVEDPLAAGVDPMVWLESLARRQGARAEELTTRADAPLPPSAPSPAAADPAAWLESLAAEGGFEPAPAASAPMSDDAIRRALQAGEEIPPDQMAAFLDRQLARQIEAGELSAQALDEEEALAPLPAFDPDAPPVPGDIPAWLLEQVQIPPAVERLQRPPLVEEIVEPPPVLDLPDWLRDDFADEQVPELEDIFAAEEPAPAAAAEFIDASDPWVEAFEQEAQMPDVDSGELPEWYTRNLRDPARLAAVERLARGEPPQEAAAALPPETHLPPGEPEAVPEWAEASAPTEALPDWLREETAADEDMPDWLREAEAAVSPADIPDWLRDTVETPEPPPAPARPPAPAAPPPAPAPVHQPAAALDVSALLASARASASAGDLNAGLAGYEQIIRANTALDAVVDDLTRLAEQHANNPAVYRVLGDGLMRQGRLQAALDTYRKALNQL